MRILQIASEFSPIAKAGGLGEMILGLAREQTRSGQEVEVILPKYRFLNLSNLNKLHEEDIEFKTPFHHHLSTNKMWSAEYENCQLHLLETHDPGGYLERDQIYGYHDDVVRFLYFSMAILEYLKIQKKPIDVIHLHDWHFALIAILARDHFKIPVKKIICTIHNAEYQGKCSQWDFDALGLSGCHYLTKDRLQDDNPDYPETLNLLKGAIVYADAVTTVSHSYAKEFLTKKMGFHIDATLRKYKKKLTPILNGIDQTFWNPNKDPHIATHYSRNSSMTTVLKSKKANKNLIKKQFALTNDSPWVGAISRLVPQKGPELIEKAIRETVKLGGVFLLLGSSPIEKIQLHFEQLKIEYANNPQVLLHLNYDEGLAHQIYAALDFLIVPSHFEPCGLTQLIAMHYGTVPIAHATGGLKDTIIDCNNFKMPAEKRNGFLFSKATEEALTESLEVAFEIFHKEKPLLQSLIRHGMDFDSSWKIPAQQYLRLYKTVDMNKKSPIRK